jgi:alkaline phosphatase D
MPPVSWGLTTRRAFLGAAAAGAGGLLLGRDPASLVAQGTRSPLPLIRGGRFVQGVSSGQVSTGGATLWTKLDGIERTSRLQVEISRDEDFRSVLYRQDVAADAESGFAVHHRAEHRVLRPGEQYFYRFLTCDESSPVGRFRTARPADSAEPVRIGFYSCQAFEAGYYTAHGGLANEPDLDYVVCLGDYIYELPFYEGPRKDTVGNAQTLEEYRRKYALYHTDPRLLELRRLHPMIAIWDDHEVEDNYAAGLQGDATQESDRRVPFAARRSNGYRAFFEHHARIRVAEEPDRTYGSVSLGAHAELFLLDQRQYRDDQACGDQFFVPCDESEAAGRTLLGARQKQWLKDALAGSRASWKLVANQAMIMALDGPPRNEINKDQWDGYAAERAELLGHVAARGVKDVAFITGDIHTFFAGEVTQSGRTGLPSDGPAVATEFVGGSMTSQGILPPSVEDPGGLTTEAAVDANNPHIRFSNFRDRGYCVVEASAADLRVVFRAPRTVAAPASDVFDLARFRVPRGTPVVETA